MKRTLCRGMLGACGLIAAGALMASCSENAGKTVTPTEATDGGSGVLKVEAKDRSFVPEHLSADGSEAIVIELVNNGALKHSLSVYEDAAYDKPVEGAEIEALEPGTEAVMRFDSPSDATKLFYRCEVHPDVMKGELNVGTA